MQYRPALWYIFQFLNYTPSPLSLLLNPLLMTALCPLKWAIGYWYIWLSWLWDISLLCHRITDNSEKNPRTTQALYTRLKLEIYYDMNILFRVAYIIRKKIQQIVKKIHDIEISYFRIVPKSPKHIPFNITKMQELFIVDNLWPVGKLLNHL